MRIDELPYLQRYHGRPCPYCGKAMLIGGPKERRPTRDHIVPRCRQTLWNQREPRIAVVCSICNHHKGNHFIEEWLKLLKAKGEKRADHVAAFVALRARSTSKYSADWLDELVGSP